MRPSDFTAAWAALKAQAAGFPTPWLDAMGERERNPFEILIGCLLSLRTKDETTGPASERLFALATTPAAMGALARKNIERAIYPVGFYRVKAERILAISHHLVKAHGGEVPNTFEGLMALPGVGRKTANLVLSVGFGQAAICVDTHVHRIPNRWGLIRTRTPEETEAALKKLIPQVCWRELNPTLVVFGQNVCRPVSPFCSRCAVAAVCQRIGVQRHR